MALSELVAQLSLLGVFARRGQQHGVDRAVSPRKDAVAENSFV